MKIASLLVLVFFLCSCNAETDMITDFVTKGFGIPISESVVEICYKDHLYRVEVINGREKYGVVHRVIPILENADDAKLKRCSNQTLKYKPYNP